MRIHSISNLKAARAGVNIETKIPFVFNGKAMEATKRIVAGEMEGLYLTKTVGEMLVSEASRKELLQKVVLDVELGRETVPVLYSPIYERIGPDPNLPRLIEAKWAQSGVVVFSDHLEGQEVEFGSLTAESGPTAKILGFAAGFEYTKEMQIFNETFNFETLNKAFGEAHNAKLNDMHLNPILDATYDAANKTAYSGVSGDPDWLRLYLTISAGLSAAAAAKRPASVLLASEAKKGLIEQAVKGGQVDGTIYPAITGITDVVYYDGWTATVGDTVTTYDGVSATKAYLVRPRRGFKELIKQDLQVVANMGDITRLVESQVVGDFWRGVYAAIGENVQELTIG